MKWYLTKIVFRIICGEGKHTPQFDEQLRLIEALNEEEAYSKAILLGNREQDSFENDKKKLVQWKFLNVSELYELSNFLDGAELYSRVQEADNADGYTELIHKKADYIKAGFHSTFAETI